VGHYNDFSYSGWRAQRNCSLIDAQADRDFALSQVHSGLLDELQLLSLPVLMHREENSFVV